MAIRPNVVAVSDSNVYSAGEITGQLGATAWVVASDAVAKILALAQNQEALGYPVSVGDGTADDSQLNSAITSGSVELSGGQFDIQSPVLISRSSVSLKGQGAATILKLANSKAKNVVEIDAPVSGNIVRVMVTGLAIDGNKSGNVAGGNQNLQNGIAIGRGVYGNLITGTIIDRVWVHDCIYSGISALDYELKTIISNFVTWSNDYHGVRGDADTQLLVSSGISYSNGIAGIYIDAGGTSIITGIWTGGNTYGIGCAGTATAGRGNAITGCMSLSDSRAIYSVTPNSSITGNVSMLALGDAFYIGDTGESADFCVVQGNNAYRPAKSGLNLTGLYMDVNHNVIEDPSFGNAATYSGATWSGTMTGTRFNFNTIVDLSGNMKYGIENNSAVAEIRGNELSGAGTASIKTVGTTCHDNIGAETKSHGTATLLNGQTSVVFAHGLGATPTHVTISWKENPSNLIADWWWTADGTNITLNGVDPGASNLDFSWEALV